METNVTTCIYMGRPHRNINEAIVGIAAMEGKLPGCVMKRDKEAHSRRQAMESVVEENKLEEIPKSRWLDKIKADLEKVGHARDREKWTSRTAMADARNMRIGNKG